MKENGYDPAEVVEIGKAEEIILGTKTEVPSLDSSGGQPIDKQFVE